MHKDQKTSKNLNYYLVKIQKPLVLALFFVMIATFGYALLYMTPFYDIYVLDQYIPKANAEHYGIDISIFENNEFYKAALKYNMSGTKVVGINGGFFTEFTKTNLQTFNHWIFKVGFIGVCVSLLLFVYFSQKRKRYFITNFVSFLVVLGFDFYVGISLITKTMECQEVVSNARFDIINVMQTLSLNNDTSSIPEVAGNYFSVESVNWIFVLGYVIAGVIIALSIISLIFLTIKFIYQLKQKAVDTSEVVINE